jgi:hypothetical protein
VSLPVALDTSPACFVPITVLLELEWVLRGAYRLKPQAVITALGGDPRRERGCFP